MNEKYHNSSGWNRAIANARVFTTGRAASALVMRTNYLITNSITLYFLNAFDDVRHHFNFFIFNLSAILNYRIIAVFLKKSFGNILLH